MSLLWPERVEVSVVPAALEWRRRSAVRRIEADPGFGPEPWHGVLEAFKLEAAAWRRERLRASVVLSDSFARYLIVPVQDAGATPQEEAALAGFHFARVHGERARTWEVRLSANSGAPRLACAIDRGLLDAIKACFASDSRARLVSVQPQLMFAYNRWRSRIPREGAWLILHEAGRTCLALVADGGWRVLHSARNGAHWRELLERERLRAAGARLPATILVDGAPEALSAPA